MNTKEIEVLLDKFYEGNTTVGEEKLLREFFHEKEIPAHLKSHQPLFVFFGRQQRQTITDAGFEKKVTGRLNDPIAGSRMVVLHHGRNRFRTLTGIAATIILLFGLFYTFQHDIFKNNLLHGNQDKQELAYAQASEALLMVSSNLNIGLRQVSRLQLVNNAIENMQLFNKFYQYQPIIINPDENNNQSIKSK
ncbi:MAG: hypothetical protein WCK34_03235 [Bacteroidota bacterium]